MANLLKQQSYFRTLVFTVMSAFVTLVLMALLFFVPSTREFLTFIVTIVLGLFLIIIYCVVTIMKKEKQFLDMSNPENYVVKFDDCPDYFNKRYDEASRKFYCSNEYIVEHPVDKSRQAIMKLMLYDENNTSIQFPNYHSNEYLNNQGGSVSKPIPSEKFYTDVFQDKSLTNTALKCSLVDDSSVREVVDDPIENRKEYKKLPWTSVRSRCNGLYAKYL